MSGLLDLFGFGEKKKTRRKSRSNTNASVDSLGRPPTPKREVDPYEERDPYIQRLYKRAQTFWTHDPNSPKVGPRGLPDHPSPNESLFFFRILFFPSQNLKDIYEKFERLNMLGEVHMDEDSIATLLSPTFEGEPDEKVYTYKHVQKELEKYENEKENSVNFRTVERFISSLRMYLLYGKQYLVWQDFKEEDHCKPVDKGECFFIIREGEAPEDERVMKMRNVSEVGYLPLVNHMKFSEGVFLHGAMQALFPYIDRAETSDEVLEMVDRAKEIIRSRKPGVAIPRFGGGRRRGHVSRISRRTRKGARRSQRGRR